MQYELMSLTDNQASSLGYKAAHCCCDFTHRCYRAMIKPLTRNDSKAKKHRGKHEAGDLA